MSQLMYSPFGALNELHRELNRMFDDRYPGQEAAYHEEATWTPQVDITENETQFLVAADLPGVDPADVDITLERNVLTIRGKRETVNESDRRGLKRRERISGTFIRQFTLPETADSDGITAKASNGVLEIRIPKAKKVQPQSIKVES
ncbi:MAG: Hsp20/alpha crystallin family protein [Pseudomonadales bacterium]|nr:Hsp20/alpha crystallin family protein [Pseudomonadales bacterium]